jgi:hypothetical protein
MSKFRNLFKGITAIDLLKASCTSTVFFVSGDVLAQVSSSEAKTFDMERTAKMAGFSMCCNGYGVETSVYTTKY